MLENEYDFIVTNIHMIYERKANPAYEMKNILHRRYVVAICLEGEGIYTIDGKIHIVAPGDVMFFPCNTLRSYRTNPEKLWHFIAIEFDLLHSERTSDYILRSISWCIKNAPPRFRTLFEELISVWTGKTTAYKLKCRTLVQEILYTMITTTQSRRTNPKHFQQIEEVRRYIQDHITENLRSEDLVAMSGLSPTHFRRLFKSIVGASPAHYANYIKVMKAKDLLEKGDMTVTQISDMLGFNNIHYFSTLFKRILHVPPSFFLP